MATDCYDISAIWQSIQKSNGIAVNPESLFDIQVKRLHEYSGNI